MAGNFRRTMKVFRRLTWGFVKRDFSRAKRGESRDEVIEVAGRKKMVQNLWQDLFSNPSQWWDNRAEKVNPRYPDFKHKNLNQALWVVDTLNPPWVETELAAMAPGTIQLDHFTWNRRLERSLKAGHYAKTMKLFRDMQGEGINPDKFTFVRVLNACSRLGALEDGRDIHQQIIQTGHESDVHVGRCLVDMYAKCGSMEDAWRVFTELPKRNVFHWNGMILGYVKYRAGLKALELYRQMEQQGVDPDYVTFVGVLNACAGVAALEDGRGIHEQITRRGYESDIFVASSLVDMYAKCGSIKDAKIVFEKMPVRNVVAWSSMILGYVKCGEGQQALELSQQMLLEGVDPDPVTFMAVLNACASVLALEEGRRVHRQIIERGYESDVRVGNCLVDMYSKCGSIEDARKVFNKMPKCDVVSWTTMLGGYALHGLTEEALKHFHRMCEEGLEMDSVTFISLLSACCHGGLVEEGVHHFESMGVDHNISPTVQHYACLIDLFGRTGRLHEAEELIKTLSEPNTTVWKSLLGACRVHMNVEIAERVARRVLELDPGNAASYVLLSNIYAAGINSNNGTVKEWQRLGKAVKEQRGQTWIEVKNKVYSFADNDRTHSQILEIDEEIERLSQQMKNAYVPNTRFVLHDLEDEDREDNLFSHSENLAIPFGLISTLPATPLRIYKELGLCGNSHSASSSL